MGISLCTSKGNEGGMLLTDEEFYAILAKLGEYLQTEKHFIDNPFRRTEIKDAVIKAHELFPNAKIELRDDPLQLGALILHMEMFDIDVSGVMQINLFTDIIRNADNFEIYPIDDEHICFAAVFQNALVRI